MKAVEYIIFHDSSNSDILSFNDKIHDIKNGQYLLITKYSPNAINIHLLQKMLFKLLAMQMLLIYINVHPH